MTFLAWLQDARSLAVLQWIQGIVTVLAVVVGGVWAYILFVRRRQRYPRANITQDLLHLDLADGKRLLRVTVRIKNEGEVLLSLASGFCRVQQLLPSSDDLANALAALPNDRCVDSEVAWPQLAERRVEFRRGEREIEPGESDELCFDFIVDADVEVVSAYTYLKNVEKRRREIGWGATSVLDLRSALPAQGSGHASVGSRGSG